MERVVNGPLNDEILEQQRELAKELGHYWRKRRYIGLKGVD
jgi:hypothetical protein